ncbi:MAG: hypothetical protein IT538_13465, partial [Variibacter sp.]|nr:hypothetical protein [Variibacter sp.]
IAWGWARRTAAGDDQAAAQLAAARKRFAGLWPLIAGFLVGSVVGAVAYAGAGLPSLAAPIAIVLGLTLWAATARAHGS